MSAQTDITCRECVIVFTGTRYRHQYMVEPCAKHIQAGALLEALEKRSRIGHKVERYAAGGISSSHAGDWEDCPLAECQEDRAAIAAAQPKHATQEGQSND